MFTPLLTKTKWTPFHEKWKQFWTAPPPKKEQEKNVDSPSNHLIFVLDPFTIFPWNTPNKVSSSPSETKYFRNFYGNGATIRIGCEIQCLPHAWQNKATCSIKKTWQFDFVVSIYLVLDLLWDNYFCPWLLGLVGLFHIISWEVNYSSKNYVCFCNGCELCSWRVHFQKYSSKILFQNFVFTFIIRN